MSEATTDDETGTDDGTDTAPAASGERDTHGESAEREATTEQSDESTADPTLGRNLYRAGLGLFGLLAVVAVIQFYASVNATINTFVTREYRSLFRMAFNLAVLLVSGAGISWCVRALRGE